MNRQLRLLLAIGALGIVLLVIGRRFEELRLPSPDDFVEYWAAGRLNAQGENPYDPEKLLPLERAAGRDTDEAIMMWNPPWTLTLVMPIGLLGNRTAQLLWLILGFVLIGLSADYLWKIYKGPPGQRWVAWLLAFTFMPTFFVLAAGQIGPWVLAGGVLFLVFLRQGWPVLAGASTVLLAIKPHLVYLFWIVLLIWGSRRNGKVLVGGAIAGLISTLIPILCNPEVIQQYWNEFRHRPPTQWKSPTLGAVIREFEGPDRFGQQFIPAFLGLTWLLWHIGKRRRLGGEWDWNREMPMLLLASFVTAAYGAWPFDLVILLPAVIQVAACLARQGSSRAIACGIAAWVALNLPALALNLLQIGSFWFIWMAPTLLAFYLLFMYVADRP